MTSKDRRRRLTAEQRQTIAARYAAGERPRHIAPDYVVSSQTVRKVAAQAGVPAQRRSSRGPLLDEAQQQHLVARYREGALIADLATEFDVSERTAHTVLNSHGVERRSPYRLTAEQEQIIVGRYEAEETATALAAEFGVVQLVITDMLRRRGVPIRRRGTAPKITGDRATELVARYQTGERTIELAADFGVAHATILNTLHRMGVETPRAKGHAGTFRLTTAQVADADRRLAAGESAVALAVEYGVAVSTLFRTVKIFREHGTTVRPGSNRLSAETHDLIVGRYAAGDALSVIAREAGVSVHTVIRLAGEAGLPRRQPRVGAERSAEIAARFEAGETAKDLAVAYGVHPQTVHNAAKRCGVPIRRSRGPRDLRQAEAGGA